MTMDRNNCAPSFSMASMAALAALLAAAALGGADGYVLSSSLRRSSTGKIHAVKKAGLPVRTTRREDGSAVKLYLFPSRHSAAATGDRRRSRGSRPSSSLPAMSPSVMAESDALPGFRTAHGLLSPEVVSRIADAHAEDLEMGEPLHRFLKTYKTQGPMSCLPMLSDPCVLPELTKAMREIA